MDFVKSLRVFHLDAKEIPCITGEGPPSESTEGAPGALYMDTLNGELYKCRVADLVNETFTWEAQEGSGYNLPVGGVQLGGVKNGGNVIINEDGTMTAPETGSAQQVNQMEPAEDDIPKVFFKGTAPTTKEEDELPLTMEYISKTKRIFSYVTLKVQGDTSAGYPKKNFNLKMFSDEARTEKLKMQFRNWKAKTHKFCLKANWIDHTHARNVVGGRLWNQIVRTREDYESYPVEYRESSNSGAVDGFPVKVYLNGVYQGLYTWNIRKDESMWNMDDSTGIHAALIADHGNKVVGWQQLPEINGTDWTDELNDTVPDAVKAAFRAAYTFVMESSDEEFVANIDQHFYLSSLIDYYIYVYSILMIGGLAKSQTQLTYDAQRFMANIYDMDTTWALMWNGGGFYDTTTPCPDGYGEGGYPNLLYERIAELYSDRIRDRYAELRATVLSDANIINEFERFMDVIPNDLYTEDFASTTAGGAFVNIPSKTTNTLQKLREVIAERMAYCDEKILTITNQIPCTGIELSASELTFTGAGTQTLTATVTPEDTTDHVIWASDNPAVAIVNSGIITAVGDGECTITVTCGEYSASCSVGVSGIGVATVNVFDGLIMESGKGLNNTTGEEKDNSGTSLSNYLNVTSIRGESATVMIAVSGEYISRDTVRIAYYDSDKKLISTVADVGFVDTVVPVNAVWCRLVVTHSDTTSIGFVMYQNEGSLYDIADGSSYSSQTGEIVESSDRSRGKYDVAENTEYYIFPNAICVVGFDEAGAYTKTLVKFLATRNGLETFSTTDEHSIGVTFKTDTAEQLHLAGRVLGSAEADF